jgi:hypothetical protein
MAQPPPGMPPARNTAAPRRLPFNPHAEQFVHDYSEEFTRELILGATEYAHTFREREISVEHVRAARADMHSRRYKLSGTHLFKQLCLICTGGVVGAGIQGIAVEWLGARDGSTLAIYALLAVVGILASALFAR